ncbi:zinc-ribbon domain-containing protein [Pseudoruegeria sp. SHC-113]|uniref:zinc-ribbon domain-containing protein n=1 Tax=Pseudoruegeria sp. SHC-113 TaxID=2855439 RepID=UPI0021BA8011|nr:zinc-ribbon domain-containing protein [Pseudoruegeria sp. SHC-113]
MRLICPNCDAQYEVDDAVIPDDGRDVQCSNCGHTWFQRPAHLDAALSEELAEEGLSPAMDPTPDTEDDVQEDVAPDDAEADAPEEAEFDEGDVEDDASYEDDDGGAYDDDGADEDVYDDEDEPVDEEYAEAGAPVGQSVLAQRQRALDESILGILKEEAERESLARQREAQSGLETQGDLGLGEPETTPAEPMTPVQERTARLRGIEPSEPETEDTRKDLLPDIEEINSSLRSTSERSPQEPTMVEPEVAERAQRRGFRIGFSLMIFVIVILICAYAYAPTIVQTVPESEAAMGQYVDLVNESRVALNGWMTSLTEKLSGLGGSEAVE